MADSVEVSTIETTDGTIGIIRDNAARQSIANLREGKETVGSVAWENVKGRPTKVSSFENDKKYQTDENVSNTLNSTLYAGSSTHGGPATSADKLTTARTISLTGAASGSGSFDGSANSSINVQSLDATKLTGTVPITNLPPSVIERMSVVKDDTERFALTTDSVQDGDVVKVQSTNLMYYVVDDTKLSTEAGYEVFKAGSAASVPWGGVTGKPSTFPPSAHTHTKSQITDFPSSMPNPNNLTMQIEGNDAAVYNGGTAQTFNVTKSALGLDKVNNTADANKSVKYASSAPWGGVTGKPSTFPPSSHTHTKSQITDLGVFGGASATAAGSAGLVPQPAAGDQDKYLSAKGTWESIVTNLNSSNFLSANDKSKTVATVPFYRFDQLNSEFGTSGSDTETYLQNWVKKIMKSHSNLSGIVIVGTANPNVQGTIIFRAYDLGNYNNTGFPRYCEGQYFGLSSEYFAFGTYEGVWKSQSFVLSNALGAVSNTINTHIANKSNPHGVTKAQVGLGNVDNTADSAKSVKYAASAGSANAVAWSNVSGRPSSLPANGGNSATVNGYSVNANVPSGAKFTDTTNKSAKYTLAASKWSGSSAPYTYDLGSTYGNNSVIGFDSAVGNTTQLEAARAADIQGSSTTKIYAYGDKPTVDIPIVIIYQ